MENIIAITAGITNWRRWKNENTISVYWHCFIVEVVGA